ncbi:MAG TPA: hypothetical protein VIU61_11160, partial [Kofleriaceae bacterium]
MNREFAFPGTRAKFAPDRVVDLQHIALVLEVDPAQRSLAGNITLRGSVIAPGTRAIELDAVELQIDVVTIGGAPAAFRHDGKRLRIELPATLVAGSELTIAIAYRGAPRRGLY